MPFFMSVRLFASIDRADSDQLLTPTFPNIARAGEADESVHLGHR